MQIKVAHVDEKMGALSMNGILTWWQVLTIPLPSTALSKTSPEQISQFLKTCSCFLLAFPNTVTPHYVQWKIHLYKPCWMSMKNKLVLRSRNGINWWYLWSLAGTVSVVLVLCSRINRYHAQAEFIALDDLFRAAAMLCRSYLWIDQIKR